MSSDSDSEYLHRICISNNVASHMVNATSPQIEMLENYNTK